MSKTYSLNIPYMEEMDIRNVKADQMTHLEGQA